MQDVYPINSVQFHPSGHYALAATEHPISASLSITLTDGKQATMPPT